MPFLPAYCDTQLSIEAAYPHLARLPHRQYAGSGVEIDHFDLGLRYRIPDRQKLALAVVAIETKRSAFGHAPAFQQRAARSFQPLAMQVLGTGRAARGAVFQCRKIDLIKQRAPQQPYDR